jgi:hypothetical protein
MRRKKSTQRITLRWGGRRKMEEVNLRHIVGTYVNVIIYPLYNYKMLIIKKKRIALKNSTSKSKFKKSLKMLMQITGVQGKKRKQKLK